MRKTLFASLAVAVAGVSASRGGGDLQDWANRTFDPLLRWFEDAPRCDGEHEDTMFVCLLTLEHPCPLDNYEAIDASSPARNRWGTTLARQSYGWKESRLTVCELSEGAGERSFELDLGRAVRRVASLHLDRFYVVSEDPDGSQRIERWVKSPTMRPGGGPWLSEEDPTWSAELLVSAGSLGEIVELCPDPEESVLLVIHGEPRRLSTLALVPGAAPAVVVTRAELPHLAHIDNLTCQVRSEGNAWFAMGIDCSDHTVLFDTDRDGVIDRWDQMSAETYYRRYNRSFDPWKMPHLRRLGEAPGRQR